jgi:hypothetical protein
VHFVTKVTDFLISASKEDSYDTPHDHIQGGKILGLLGLDLKCEMVFGIIWVPLSYIDDFLYEWQKLRNMRNGLFRFVSKITKHAKQLVSLHSEISRNNEFVSRNTKLVSFCILRNTKRN